MMSQIALPIRLVSALVLCSIASAAAPSIAISERASEPLLKAEKPWEDFTIGYCNVIRTGDRWRMWYAAYDHNYRNDNDGVLCYAESDDGVHWIKPELNVFEYAGSKKNNIVLGAGSHGACVFLDPAAEPGGRFKIAYVKLVNKRWPIFGGTSPDGIHWTLPETPLLDRNSDTQQTCFRDGDAYRLYVRMWAGPGDFHGKRLVGFSQSKTFGEFSDPVRMLAGEASDPKDLQFYNSAVAKLRDDLYVMFPSAFYTKEDVVRVHAAVSRDGEQFERAGRTPVLELGKGFDRMTMYIAPGAVATEKPNDFWFYYFGGNVGHDQSKPDRLHFGGGIGRFLVTVKE